MDSDKEKDENTLSSFEELDKIASSPKVKKLLDDKAVEEIVTGETKITSEELKAVLDDDTKNSIKKNVEVEMNVDHPDFMKPQRLKGETDPQYSLRRKVQKMYVKQKKGGSYAWISKDLQMPIYKEEDKEKENPIAHVPSKGFTFDRKKVQAAVDAKLAEETKTKEEKDKENPIVINARKNK